MMDKVIDGLDLLPDYMRSGMERYLLHGISPGGFLTAVLENNLVEAFARADMTNRPRLWDYAKFLHNYAPKIPVPAWGSPEIVAKWIKAGGLNGPKPATQTGRAGE